MIIRALLDENSVPSSPAFCPTDVRKLFLFWVMSCITESWVVNLSRIWYKVKGLDSLPW